MGGIIMAKRVYRGHCPYENYFEIELECDCRNCRNFELCCRKEKKRLKHKKEGLIALGKLISIVLLVALVITSLVRFVLAKCTEEKQSTEIAYIIVEPTYPETRIKIQVELESDFQKADVNEYGKVLNLSDKEINVSSEEQETVQPVISAYEPGEVYYYNLSDEEKVYIAKVVYAESRGECFEGQVAVAATVLNRYTSDDRRFCRDSIYSVITQSGQYASICGVTLEKLDKVPSCMEAVEAACKGWDPTRVVFSDGAKFFFNPDGDLDETARREREGILTYRIGAHLFHNDFNVI